jgi:hypothetical protein
LEAELASSMAVMESLHADYRQTGALLQQEAVLSYADAVPSLDSGDQSGNFFAQADRSEYFSVAVGDLTQTMARFQSEQSALKTLVATRALRLRGDLTAERQAAAARQAALDRAASLQATLAQAQAAEDALASAARSSTGPPVGNGIVTAVAQQLGASPTGASASATGLSSGASATPATGASPTAVGGTSTTRALLERGALSPTTLGPRATTTSNQPTTTSNQPTLTTHQPTTTTNQPTTTTNQPTATAQFVMSRSTTVPITARPATTASPVPLATTTTVPPTTTITVPPTTTTAPAPVTTTTADPPPPTSAAPAGVAPVAVVAAPPAGGVWLELRECESGDNYQADTGNGYYGAYQFSWSTWNDMGYPGRPDEEPYWMQDQAAQRLEVSQGWGQWPSCSAALGL